MFRLFISRGKKTTTVFRQLILNIVIPVVLALMILATINYYQTQNILIKSNNVKNEIITNEVRHIIKLQDFALDILEKKMDKRMDSYSSYLVNNTIKNTDNVKQLDLNNVRLLIGMNPEMDDLYIINKEGYVINTTFDKDLNKNFFDFGEDHKRMLKGVFLSSKFVSERFTLESATQRLKKYTYQTSDDGKYIIEIGSYSKEADDIIEFVQKILFNISSKDASLVSVDLFIGEENPFTFNKDAVLLPEHKKILLERYKKKNAKTIVEKVNGKELYYEYIYMERENTDLYKGAVIRIVSDRDSDKKLLLIKLLTAILIFVVTIVSVVLIIYYKTRVIIRPIKKLVENVSETHLVNKIETKGSNEITTLSVHFNDMLARIEIYYKELEEKVKERTAEAVLQKEQIEEKNIHITDSIRYAKRIQTAILPPEDYVKKLLPKSFVFYKPKDIVSGDFYWIKETNDSILVSAVDCTGHGVPGAFMSIVGNYQLNYAVDIKEANKPANILMELNSGVNKTLQKDSNSKIKDGMDLAICSVDYKNKKLQFAGACNPLYIIKNGELQIIKGDKFSIGSFDNDEGIAYKNHEIDVEEGDTFYIFSDGYADQFGGPKDKKYLYKRFREFLLSIHNKPMDKQRILLEANMAQWMGDKEQVDDIIVIGVKI